MKAIIFDLDLTLVDTNILEAARQQRNWQLAYNQIKDCQLYDGVEEVFNVIRKNNIKVAIVSTSPRPYIEKIIAHFNIPAIAVVGYHDAKPIKPHPAPMLKAIQLLNEHPSNIISFGDRVIDIQASNSANIESVACFWGTKEKKELLHSGYSHALIKPIEIISLIR